MFIGTEMRVGKSEALVPVVSVNDKMVPDPPHCKVSTEMTDAFDKIYRWRTWAGNMPLQPPSFVLYSCCIGQFVCTSTSKPGPTSMPEFITACRALSVWVAGYP